MQKIHVFQSSSGLMKSSLFSTSSLFPYIGVAISRSRGTLYGSIVFYLSQIINPMLGIDVFLLMIWHLLLLLWGGDLFFRMKESHI